MCTRPCPSGCWIELKRELTPGLVCCFSWTQRIVVVLASAVCLRCLDSGKCKVKGLKSVSVTYYIKRWPHLTCQKNHGMISNAASKRMFKYSHRIIFKVTCVSVMLDAFLCFFIVINLLPFTRHWYCCDTENILPFLLGLGWKYCFLDYDLCCFQLMHRHNCN